MITDRHLHDDGRFDSDVLIVGAGPVGLTAACALAHHGVRSTIVDSREDPRSESRANNIWARPQELLDAIGLRDPLADGAHEVVRAQFVMHGRSIDEVRFDDVASPFPSVLYSSQGTIERTLRQTLTDRGQPVESAVTLEEVHQDTDGVDAVLRLDDGRQVTHRTRYLIGADGQNSSVRRSVEIALDREDFPRRATRQIDARLSWRRPTTRDTLWFFVYENGFAGVLPIEGEHHRLFFVEDDAVVPEREPTLEEAQQRAREVTGDPTVTLRDPIWASHTRFEHGVADAHAAGRVFLVGDAGHLNLPIGGQGMNAGMHDAVGLAWRLAMTLAGHGGPIVLGSYAAERGREHRRLGRQQVSGFRRLMYRSRLQDRALDVAADLIPDIGTRLLGAEELHQLAVAYPDSPLSAEHRPRALRRRTIRPGDRAPDARGVRDGATTTVFEQFHDPEGRTWDWTLLGFDADGAHHTDLLTALTAAAADHPWLAPRLVRRTGEPRDHGGIPVLWDLDGGAHSAYGATAAATTALVRPDGHLALLAPADDRGALLAYCDAVAPARGSGPPHRAARSLRGGTPLRSTANAPIP